MTINKLVANSIISVANTQITGNIISSKLQPTGVTAATYGNATIIPSVTIDQQGRITSASNVVVDYASNTYVNIREDFIQNTFMIVAMSDETTSLTTGNGKVRFRAPFGMTLWQIPRASVNTASTSGVITIDIDENGNSIFSTRLTIDANEKSSTTAAAPAVLSDTSIADDAEITFDIIGAGTGANGLKVILYYSRT